MPSSDRMSRSRAAASKSGLTTSARRSMMLNVLRVRGNHKLPLSQQLLSGFALIPKLGQVTCTRLPLGEAVRLLATPKCHQILIEGPSVQHNIWQVGESGNLRVGCFGDKVWFLIKAVSPQNFKTKGLCGVGMPSVGRHKTDFVRLHIQTSTNQRVNGRMGFVDLNLFH